MSKSTRQDLAWLAAFVALVVIAAGALTAEPPRLRVSAGAPAAEPLTQTLPSVVRSLMTPRANATGTPGLEILSFDDGTCEAGLGAGVTVTALVDFDVPTQCIQAGLEIIGLTARMNTGTGTAFAFGQAGATPPSAGAVSTVQLATALPPLGPCPDTLLTKRVIGPGAAVITDTSNFFAGLITPSGFAGRDTNSPPAGRIWLNCAACGNTQYSPTDLSNLGLGGNWMIRVAVEEPNCIPVELMEFIVSDG